MSSTVLEQLRAEQEEIESFERAVVATLGEKPRNVRRCVAVATCWDAVSFGRVLHGHKVSNLLDEVVQHSEHVKELYDDKDQYVSRPAPLLCAFGRICAVSCGGECINERSLVVICVVCSTFAEETENMRGRAVFTSFYEQLKSIRAFHRKYPNSVVSHEPNMEDALHPNVQVRPRAMECQLAARLAISTIGEGNQALDRAKSALGSTQAKKTQEALNSSGKVNGQKQQPARASIDYLAYLASFSDFSAIPAAQKTKSAAYQQYLKELKGYLLDFYRRTQPLVDLDDVIGEASAKFEKQWALHEVAGWDSSAVTAAESDNSSSAHFCKLCDKQFSSEGVFNSHLTGKKHKRFAAAAAEKDTAASQNTVNDGAEAKKELQKKHKAIAFDEVLIRRMYELLTEVVHATISYLELKQTRTHEELQAEIAEDEEGTFSDVDVENENLDGEDEEEQFYNPLNLPLGWDGKPIPYWLYKLHGLGVEFKCEICGNHSYWGRRAFDRHFQEWRHAFGMRCLKIPNTKHFHDITLMRDAIQLYEKLKDQITDENWNAANEEEFEDSEGNVLNRKTFEDLARQGLL
ncbi:hypothetical protein BBJ28_00013664 [Nothophytophthora sp. Chile5]|nr:hypothetical protein BBJ28_00013664 [Nothophytophthora sp. Chile5]